MSTPRNIKDRAVSQLAGPTLIPGGFATAIKNLKEMYSLQYYENNVVAQELLTSLYQNSKPHKEN